MIEKLEPYFKWLCLVLFGCLLFVGAYNWRDARHEVTIVSLESAAKTLSQLNNLIGLDQSNLIRQVNDVLKSIGYASLVRNVRLPKPALAPIPREKMYESDTTSAETDD